MRDGNRYYFSGTTNDGDTTTIPDAISSRWGRFVVSYLFFNSGTQVTPAAGSEVMPQSKEAGSIFADIEDANVDVSIPNYNRSEVRGRMDGFQVKTFGFTDADEIMLIVDAFLN